MPQVGSPNSTEDAKIASDFTTLQTLLNGNIDATNVTQVLALAASINQAGQLVKGSVNIATSETLTSTSYSVMPTPDQVTNIVLPTNGLLTVWYQATWSESVNSSGAADLFLGANEAKGAFPNHTAPDARPATLGGGTNISYPISTFAGGLVSNQGLSSGTSYTTDVTTGQYVAGGLSGSAASDFLAGGPAYIFAAAGTYTVSVQFKSTSGTLTVKNRKLWVQAMSFV